MPAHRVPRVQLICAYQPCAKPFEVTPGDADRVRYCSPGCRRSARQQRMTKEPVTLLCAYIPCSKPFDVIPHQANIWKYCSQPCYHLARLTQTHEAFAARFWNKVDKTPGHGPKGVCWLWTGATHANGYGNFRATPYKEGNVSTHIASWFLKTGEWPPEGLFVCHTCDVRLCVNNEACLFLGTHMENVQDMQSKGRKPRGDMSTSHKITEAQVEEAAQLHATGQWSFSQLARRYGVTRMAVTNRVQRYNSSLF